MSAKNNYKEWSSFAAVTHPYIRAWTDKMVEIWRDRIEQLDINDTGALLRSIEDGHLALTEDSATAEFRFLLYGIFVDLGTGNGYKDKAHGNDGDLEILDPYYRLEHGLTNMRKRRPWFNTPWYISKEVMKSKLAAVAGESFVGLLDTLKEKYRK